MGGRRTTVSDTIARMAREHTEDRYRIERLAQYKAERDRCIMHTLEWRTLMLAEQDWFDARQRGTR